jgi:hypothetical protein
MSRILYGPRCAALAAAQHEYITQSAGALSKSPESDLLVYNRRANDKTKKKHDGKFLCIK